jgi:hypothetical protein
MCCPTVNLGPLRILLVSLKGIDMRKPSPKQQVFLNALIAGQTVEEALVTADVPDNSFENQAAFVMRLIRSGRLEVRPVLIEPKDI